MRTLAAIVIGAVLLGLLAAVAPSVRAARLDPLTALTSQ
jgi:ABC-type lipoprotein release transport system permease subunit